jgi:NAD(P)-dependent dehydrogenase (short-subunit alcohol dehydrogenase family)
MPPSAERVVLVTGAGSGIGAATASRFAAAGCHVLVADLADEAGGRVVEEIRATGGEADFHPLDVAERASWDDLVAHLGEKTGTLHSLVNVAGIAQRKGRVMNTTPDDLDALLAVNLKGPLFGIQACASLIRESGGGSIVNVGSIAGMTGHFAAGYSMSKWGLRGLTKSAALELADWGIRVVAVHPGIVATPIVTGSDDFVDAMRSSTPLRRIGDPDELASVIEFLAGPGAAFVTGVDIAVDGGLTDLGNYFHVAEYVKAQQEQRW